MYYERILQNPVFSLYTLFHTQIGGMPGKMLGRVGDSPLFGSGAYGDPNGCCSSTGHGESLIKTNICRQV